MHDTCITKIEQLPLTTGRRNCSISRIIFQEISIFVVTLDDTHAFGFFVTRGCCVS